MWLAKGAQVLGLHVVPETVGEAVLQDRGVAATQDEAVTIAPERVGGVVSQNSREKHDAKGRQRHCRTAMTGLGGRRSVHRQCRYFANRTAFQFSRTVE